VAQVATGQQSTEVAALVDQLAAPPLPFDPATIRKGTITAYNPTADPPSVDLTISGDDTTTISAVRYLDSYSPVVGDTVLIVKQGTDIVVLGQIHDGSLGANGGWQTPTPSSGFTNNGNGGGNPAYRLVVDHGDLKIQWKGSVAHTGTNTAIFAAAQVPAPYRPTSTRNLLTARDITGGSTAVGLQFNTDGSVVLVGPTTFGNVNGGNTGTASGGSTGATSINATDLSDYQICGYLSQAGSDLCHAHNTTVVGNHTHTMGSHTHTFTPTGAVADPTWISFNGIEYFV
jgi:hypothetical protein